MTKEDLSYLASQTQAIGNLANSLQSLAIAYDFPTAAEPVIDDLCSQIEQLDVVICAFKGRKPEKVIQN